MIKYEDIEKVLVKLNTIKQGVEENQLFID